MTPGIVKERLNQQPETQSDTDLTSLPEELTVIVEGKSLEADFDTWPEIGFPLIMGASGETEESEQSTSERTEPEMADKLMTETEEKWVSLGEAARITGYSKGHLSSLAKDKEIPAKPGPKLGSVQTVLVYLPAVSERQKTTKPGPKPKA